jgi:predicted GTPase
VLIVGGGNTRRVTDSLHDYLNEMKIQEVSTIVSAMEKTGYSFTRLVHHYVRVNGATERVLDRVDKIIDESDWEQLMESCGFAL